MNDGPEPHGGTMKAVTDKQKKYIEYLGYKDDIPEDMTSVEASTLIGRLRDGLDDEHLYQGSYDPRDSGIRRGWEDFVSPDPF